MRSRQSESQQKNTLLLFSFGTLGLNAIMLLLLFFNQSLLQSLSRQLTPQSLIELENGTAITADPEENLERQPATLSRFVGESMTLMLTSSARLPPRLVLNITSGLFSKSFQTRFANEILEQQRSLRSGREDANLETVLVIEKISAPLKIEAGQWKLEIVAHQLLFSSSDLLGKSLPFHKQIWVRAIPQNPITLPNKSLPLDLATYRLGEARLEIYQICDFQQKTCPQNPKP
jgi:hypothetical protein